MKIRVFESVADEVGREVDGCRRENVLQALRRGRCDAMLLRRPEFEHGEVEATPRKQARRLPEVCFVPGHPLESGPQVIDRSG